MAKKQAEKKSGNERAELKAEGNKGKKAAAPKAETPKTDEPKSK